LQQKDVIDNTCQERKKRKKQEKEWKMIEMPLIENDLLLPTNISIKSKAIEKKVTMGQSLLSIK